MYVFSLISDNKMQDQRTCIVCNTSGLDNSAFHKISYDRNPTKQDEPSLAERVAKIIKIDDIYGTNREKGITYPLLMCSGCLEEMVQIENAIKVKKKFNKSLKKKLSQFHGDSSGAAGYGRQRRSSSSGSKVSWQVSEVRMKKKKNNNTHGLYLTQISRD